LDVALDVALWVWPPPSRPSWPLIALDFVTVSRNPHEVTLREAGVWSAVYIGVALVFGVLVWLVWGGEFGAEYLAGWLVEKTLSVDNLFVYVIIMTRRSTTTPCCAGPGAGCRPPTATPATG
jgi:tellurite resistance protein TerC